MASIEMECDVCGRLLPADVMDFSLKVCNICLEEAHDVDNQRSIDEKTHEVGVSLNMRESINHSDVKEEKIELTESSELKDMTEYDIKSDVVIIGKSGSGKSLLLNMLYNKRMRNRHLQRPASVGNKCIGETNSINYYKKDGLYLVDTIGLADPLNEARTTSIVLKFLKSFDKLRKVKIIFVIKAERLTKETRKILLIFNQIFERNWAGNMIVVFTHAEESFNFSNWKMDSGDVNDESRDEFNLAVKILETSPFIFQINNSCDGRAEHYVVPERIAVRHTILNAIKTTNCIKLRDNSLIDKMMIWIRILFGDKILKKTMRYITELTAINEDPDVVFGYCSICQSNINDRDNHTTIDECDHNFHTDHLTEWFRTSNKSICALCQTDCKELRDKLCNNDLSI